MAAQGGGRIPVFINAEAGGVGARAVERLRAVLEAAGVDADIRSTPPAALADAVRAAATAGASIIAVAGGDGTLSTAADALRGGETALAPIPLGTLNHFARRLGIETPEDAARALAGRRIVTVPVGTVNGRTFINNAASGLYPHMVRHRERWRRWLGKWPASLVAWVYVLGRMRATRLTLEAHGHRIDRTAVGVWVGLGRGSFQLPRDAREAEARELEIVVPRAHTRAALIGLALRTLRKLQRGETPAGPGLDVLHAPAFTLESRRRVDIARDGEPERLVAPLEFRVHPDALRVVAPVRA